MAALGLLHQISGSSTCIRTANSQDVGVKGSIVVSFKIGPSSFTHKFVVCEGIRTQWIPAIKHLYYWKGMRAQILQYCKSHKVCAVQKVKKKQFAKQIFEPGVQPMQFVSMDLIGEFHPPHPKVTGMH